jgi:orotate phosphoribosyltransferase
VISAGSAVGRTAIDLDDCGATTVAIAALLILGDWTARFAAERNLAVIALDEQPLELWKPEDCPLCARGVPLT